MRERDYRERLGEFVSPVAGVVLKAFGMEHLGLATQALRIMLTTKRCAGRRDSCAQGIPRIQGVFAR